jgi:hypothetical protein
MHFPQQTHQTFLPTPTAQTTKSLRRIMATMGWKSLVTLTHLLYFTSTSPTFDIYVANDQPGECTGEFLGSMSQPCGTYWNTNQFINGGCLIEAGSGESCCTIKLFSDLNCTQEVVCVPSGDPGQVIEVDFSCAKMGCLNGTKCGYNRLQG